MQHLSVTIRFSTMTIAVLFHWRLAGIIAHVRTVCQVHGRNKYLFFFFVFVFLLLLFFFIIIIIPSLSNLAQKRYRYCIVANE